MKERERKGEERKKERKRERERERERENCRSIWSLRGSFLYFYHESFFSRTI